jgi:hypothetical protein
MKQITFSFGILIVVCAIHSHATEGIDRKALVSRHNIEWNEPRGQIPLGNGEFCFNADATGLQTFGGNTLSHWAWHSEPLPPGCWPSDIPATGTVETGHITGPMQRAAAKPELDSWMFRNPHPLNLARLRFVRANGSPLKAENIAKIQRRLDLWTGLHSSQFEVDGQLVTVKTCVHPTLDLVAVRVESTLLRDCRLLVALDFSYPCPTGDAWIGDWTRPDAHTSELLTQSGRYAVVRRHADEAVYYAGVSWGDGCAFSKWSEDKRKALCVVHARYGNGNSWIDSTEKVRSLVHRDSLSVAPNYLIFGDPLPGQAKQLELIYTLDGATNQVVVADNQPLAIQTLNWKHTFRLAGDKSGKLEFACAFSSNALSSLPTSEQTRLAAADHWREFWTTGGAIDLSDSKDPRWKELERRIVLSQYQMAAQSAGNWPSAEVGLMGLDAWNGQFHMEMVWWHLAHYGLWNRWSMAERALDCYHKFLPVAKTLATQLGYRGAKWGKQVGPEGRTAPWVGSFALHWQQPHPIFLAELEYRVRPTRATLEKWRDIIQSTADYMADFPTADNQGTFHLQPVVPPCEQGFTRDDVFDLAYWRWGLDQAQRWRERLGLPRERRWDEIRRKLAPLPVDGDVFVHSAEWHDTYTKRAYEHPDPVGVFGMLPPMDGVDRETAHHTVLKVWQTWDWKNTWGWDFPWMAMAAARVGEPQIAVDALLKDAASRNAYDKRGVNAGGPCPYLPGNGGLLYAVAMMAAGWEGGPSNNAPGFPSDRSWIVKHEGLRKSP